MVNSQQYFSDHVGIVVRFSLNDVRIYDSNIDTGVTLLPWDIFIEENDLYCRAAVRKLHYHDKYDKFPLFMKLVGVILFFIFPGNIGKKISHQSYTIIKEKVHII